MSFSNFSREAIRDDSFFNILINFWLVQTLLMTIAIILSIAFGDSNPELGRQLLVTSMYMDSALMIGFIVWGSLSFPKNKLGAALVIIGALGFLILSTTYRALLEFYPDFGHVKLVTEALGLQPPNLDPSQPFDALFEELGRISVLILYTNGALVVLSFGVSSFVARLRLKNYMRVYGFINLVFAAYPLILFFKPIFALLLLISFHFSLYSDRYRMPSF